MVAISAVVGVGMIGVVIGAITSRYYDPRWASGW